MWPRFQRLFGDRPPAEVPESGPRGETERTRGVQLFRLTVDDGGEFLVVRAAALTLGHTRSPAADLAFLADVDDVHAELEVLESLSRGRTWTLRPVGESRVEVAGEVLEAFGRVLSHDDRVLLGGNLAFRFQQPDPSSSSAVLELQRGIECFGATNVLLLDDGPGGQVRIGPSRSCHVGVTSFSVELRLAAVGERLELMRYDLEGNVLSTHGLRVPLPLAERVPVSVPRGGGSGKAPLLVTLSPVQAPSGWGSAP